MHHYYYSKFTLQARSIRAKLASRLEPHEWFGDFSGTDVPISHEKSLILKMDEILQTVDPLQKEDILDAIEDLSEENKVKLGELLGLCYEPKAISEDEWES